MFETFFKNYISPKNIVFMLLSILFIIFVFKNSDIAIMFFASYVLACSLNPFVNKLVEKKKSEMAEEFKQKKTTEQENEKILGNKTKRNKDESKSKNLGLNKSEFKKKKRLETYGITDNE